MLAKQLEERLLILVPAKPVFGMAYLKPFEMKFSEKPLVSVAVRIPENVSRTISLISATLNNPPPAEQGKSCFRDACCLPQRGKAMHGKAVAKIKFNRLPPHPIRSALILVIGCLEDLRLLVDQLFTVESQFQQAVPDEPTVNVCEVLLQLGHGAPHGNMKNIFKDDFCEMTVRLLRFLADRQLLNIVVDDVIDVKMDRSGD